MAGPGDSGCGAPGCGAPGGGAAAPAAGRSAGARSRCSKCTCGGRERVAAIAGAALSAGHAMQVRECGGPRGSTAARQDGGLRAHCDTV